MEGAESADAKYLYYAKREVRGVFRLSLQVPEAPEEEAPEEKVLDLGGEGRWWLTRRGILVLDLRSGNPPTIRFHDLASRTTSVVVHQLPLAPEWEILTLGGAFTVSPDESWALIGTGHVTESDISLLDGFR
jgi:hypothetical protein